MVKRHADDVIGLAVRWYVRYRVRSAGVIKWFAERGLVVDGVPSISGFKESSLCLLKRPVLIDVHVA